MIKPTKEEFELMVTETASRLRDIAYSDTERYTEKMMRRLHLNNQIPENDSEYKFIFTISMVAGDFRQIISRLRRIHD